MKNYRDIQRVLWVTLGLNLIATVAKLIVGYWTNSLSLIADGFDSVFDAASNVVGLVGIYLAARPADEEHPYGHHKAETMTALVISSLLFLTTWELIKSAVERLRDPSLIQAEVNVWSFAALLTSIVVHAAVVWYELRAGRRLHSDVLVADAMHTRADIFVSLSVIGGLIAVKVGYPLVDPILAIAIALVIAKIGIDIIREGSPTLLDQMIVSPDQVEQIVGAVPGVISSHGIRSRGHEAAAYVDLHIQVDPTLSTQRTHAIAHEVQHQLREQIPNIEDVTIHVEPAGSTLEEEAQQEIESQVRQIAVELRIAIHDVWIHRTNSGYYADIHAEADGSLTLRKAHALISLLEERARAEIPDLADIIAHIEPREDLAHPAGNDLEKAHIAQAVQQVTTDTLSIGAFKRVQVRRSETGWSVSLHCTLPGEMSLTEAHRTCTRLEEQLRDKIPELERVVIHSEPREE